MDKTTIESLDSAKLSKYTFRLRPVNTLTLPPFKIIPFRGGFGKALLETVCPEQSCKQDDCQHRFQCAYSYIFETPVPKDAEVLSLNSNITQPFIIEFPPNTKDVYENTETLDLVLTLIGNAIDYLPYCIFAFERLGVMGIGRNKGKYRVENVISQEDQIETIIFSGNEKKFLAEGKIHSFAGIMNTRENDRQMWRETQSVEIRFLSPGRFEYSGEIISKELEFHILFRSILRRLSTLLYFHCGKRKLPIDFKQLIEDAKEIKISENNLHWLDIERYSTRKGKSMKLGGVIGRIRYQGSLEQFIPFLLLAAYIHAGKSVSFGFGQITIH